MMRSRICTPATLKDLQAEILRLLQIVDRICRENNIEYWIDGGTLLGAVRHKGFIPWDDDLDICVASDDYHRLLSLLDSESKNNSDIFLFYYKNKYKFWCEYLGSTKMVMSYNKRIQSCKLDIFPMKFINKSDQQKDKEITDIAHYFISGNVKYKEKFNNWCEKKILNHTLAINYMNYFNNEYLPSCRLDKSNSLITYSFGDSMKVSDRDYYLYSDIYPLRKIEFEKHYFFAPNNINKYLSILYGNYMSLPPKSKQTPYRDKYYFCHNTKFALDKTKEYISKFNYIEYYLDDHIINNYAKELQWLRGCLRSDMSLVNLCNLYSVIPYKKDVKYFFRKGIRNKINLLQSGLSFKINPALLVYYLRYKIKHFFKTRV